MNKQSTVPYYTQFPKINGRTDLSSVGLHEPFYIPDWMLEEEKEVIEERARELNSKVKYFKRPPDMGWGVLYQVWFYKEK